MDRDVIISLAAGVGGDLMIGYPDPWQFEHVGTDVVDAASQFIKTMGARVQNPDHARDTLGLR